LREEKEITGRCVTRREFLKRAAGVAAVGLVGAGSGSLLEEAFAASKPAKSRVVLVTHKKVLAEGWQMNLQVLQEMMDEGMKKLTREKSASAAWKKIVKPNDVVSIKWNELGGPNIRSHQELMDACAAAARSVGVPEDKVLVWSRSQRVPDAYKGWSEEYKFPNGKSTKIGSVLDKHTTCLINLPVVKTHSSTGFTCALKNHMGSNSNPGQMHSWDSSPAPMWENIAYINNTPGIRRCTKLIIADATRPLFNGGPGDDPAFRWDYHTLVCGTDPVAVDRVCIDIVDEKRKAEGLPPADVGRKCVELAGQLGIGSYDLAKIEIVKLELA